MVKNRFPKQGDLIWIDLDPTIGHEQNGRRPALVVSGNTYNKNSGLALMCPITSKTKNYPFIVPFSSKKIKGFIIADQVRCLDWSNPKRKYKFIESLPREMLETVCNRIKTLIDLA